MNFNGPGGGMAIPPYLQGRKPVAGGTQPMITPKQSIVPGETKPPQQGMLGNAQNMFDKLKQPGGQQPGGNLFDRFKPKPPGLGALPNQPLATQPQPPTMIQPKVQPPQGLQVNPTGGTGTPAPDGGGSTSQKLYDYLKQDLEDNRRTGMSNAVSDANSRGVYYGSPLTTSQGDIETQYLRGLGSLQAGVLQNEQGNELSRLQIASQLLSDAGQAQGGAIDPMVYQMMGQLFGQSPTASGQRNGPSAPAPYQYKPLPDTSGGGLLSKLRGITPKPVQ